MVRLLAGCVRLSTLAMRELLARAEGLGDVVVSPELEPGNGGELVARRGEEHDGQLGYCLLEGSADGKAVAFGKGDVKQDEGVRTRAVAAGGERAGKRRRLRGSGVDRIALALKKLSQGGDDGRIVLHQQDARAHGIP